MCRLRLEKEPGNEVDVWSRATSYPGLLRLLLSLLRAISAEALGTRLGHAQVTGLPAVCCINYTPKLWRPEKSTEFTSKRNIQQSCNC